MKAFARATALALAVLGTPLTSTSLHAQDDGWRRLEAGNARIDVPTFFLDYESEQLLENGEVIGIAILLPEEGEGFSFYSVPRAESPYERVSAGISSVSAEVTYSVDKPRLGVVSGYVAEGDYIFYLMCKGRDEELHCFELSYSTSRRALFDPAVERLARSLR